MTTTLITGTSSGMGLHAAIALARRGHRVIATLRRPDAAHELRSAAASAGVELDLRALDVTDEEACSSVVAAVQEQYGGIDVLVNNAGLGMVGTAEQLSMEAVEEQIAVNYLAPVRLTKLVLPGMREAGHGRILSVTSVGGAVGQPFADAYCGAKFALEGFMQSLAPVAERCGVHVSVMEPAAVASSFVENAVRPEVEDGPYAELLGAYYRRTEGAFAAAQSAESAGEAIAAAACDPSPVFRYQSSEGATAFVSASLADTDGERVLGFTRGWLD
ncbi:MAG: SDR family NAD(P)-dependent oxidoreductase [Arthrobacter sp.]|jgi:short-subunit dehydrogenase|nr:SDR family NAD(P)-dependent oxidoreductase [Arthrobacter sp.]